MPHEWESERVEVIYHAGFLVITDKAAPRHDEGWIVQLRDDRGRNITLREWHAGVRYAGVDRAARAFTRLDGKGRAPIA